MSSATIAIANSAGVFAPNFKPMGRYKERYSDEARERHEQSLGR